MKNPHDIKLHGIKMGILIAIDGVDASGKQTQTELLYERLSKETDVSLVSFPMYNNPSSTLVKMYLNGDFGADPKSVNAYAASIFFASDRYATYKTTWGKDYKSSKIIIADRYVSSNMIHQAGKIEDVSEKERFLEWQFDLEYNKLGLPRPDITIFLDMPPEWGAKLMAERANKITGEKAKDIHENNGKYLEQSYRNALFVAEKYNWDKISCIYDGGIKKIEDIHEEIYSKVKDILTLNGKECCKV